MANASSRRICSTRTRAFRRLQRWVSRHHAAWLAMRDGVAGGNEATLISGLQSGVPRARWESAAQLGRHSHRSIAAVEALMSALADSEEFVRWQASTALARQDAGRVFTTLRDGLSSQDARVRAGAVTALGQLGGEAAAALLVRRVDDADAMVRAAVADALSRVCDPTCATRLIPLLHDASPEVRRSAARALGRIGATDATEPLAQVLGTHDQPLLVRRSLAAALAHIPHPDAQPVLLRALADSDPQVRGYAAQALGQAGDESACAPLQALRSDTSRLLQGTVGDSAAHAISMLERRGRRAHTGLRGREARR